MVDRKNASLAPGVTSTAAGVLRPDELARHLQLRRLPGLEALAPWVENHWTLRWDLPAGRTYVSSTLPHPAANLSIERGVHRDGVFDDPVVVTGIPTRRFDVTISGTGWVHGVKFRPGGLTSLTGVSARDLRNTTVPAAQVFGRPIGDALRTLGPEAPAEECRTSVERVLIGLRASPEPDYQTVLAVVATMLGDRSLVRVGQVEEALGISTRTLQRLFAHYVGVSPKWVLSRYRMHDVVSTLDAGYDGSLADLAACFGWFDQAHFTGQFTDLVGVPPGRYQRTGLS